MQHRYVPDLGDFSKFGLIRALAATVHSPARFQAIDPVALIWYLNDPPRRRDGSYANQDGRHTRYLLPDHPQAAHFRDCDPLLYDQMQMIHRIAVRDIHLYRRWQVPLERRRMRYHEAVLRWPVATGRNAKAQRAHVRQKWLHSALEKARGCAMVVLDPDNGLLPASLTELAANATRYATLDECRALSAQGQRTLVLYQHTHRRASAICQIQDALTRLADALDVERSRTMAMRFRKGTSRAYLIVATARHTDTLRERCQQMVQGPWGQHGFFDFIDSTDTNGASA